MPTRAFTLTLLPGAYAVSRLEPDAAIPAWATASAGYVSITRADDELSVVCAEAAVPANVRSERGWRCLKVAGPFAFAEIGVLAALATALAQAGVSIFAVSTYDTDYLLIKSADAERARAALSAAGHRVVETTGDTRG